MRSENEWFKPEQLTRYYFVVEALALVVALAVVLGAYLLSIYTDFPLWMVGGLAALTVLLFGYVTWWIPAFYRTAAYRLTDEELEYRRGVFFQQRTTVPYNRITNVNAAQGPIQRAVGAGEVQIHTAGYGGQMGAELTIDGVADFEDIKEQVLAKTRRQRPVGTESGAVDGVGTTVDDGTRTDDPLLGEVRRIRELLEDEAR